MFERGKYKTLRKIKVDNGQRERIKIPRVTRAEENEWKKELVSKGE